MLDVSEISPGGHPDAITVSALADFDGKPGGLQNTTVSLSDCTEYDDDSFACFSNFGTGVDIMAPGVNIRSTYLNGGQGIGSGTSLSCPHVAGAAALYLIDNPGSTPAQVKEALIANGDTTPCDSPDGICSDDPDGIQEPLLYYNDQCPDEICDGLDNDCDGQVDENLTQSCSTACGTGSETCQNGSWVNCSAQQPGIEICDGLDNNCDGNIDEGVTNACGTCGPLPVEVCDGLDNDCDGQVDENLTQSCSTACGTGSETCQNGSWVNCSAQQPGIEICDGLDNNCDGNIDEGVTNACGTCGPLPVEVCDGLDNNCDGVVDEGVTNECGNCGPVTEEACDGIDNNCNGEIDEGFDEDADLDTIKDCVDNCVFTENTDQSDMDEDGTGDLCDNDVDGDGMLNEEEGYEGVGTESVDSNDDGIPDYMDTSTTHFKTDDQTGEMILIVSNGSLESCIEVDETTMPTDGKPKNVDFIWGFIEFIITGLAPFESVSVALIGPEELADNAEYWKYDANGYYQIADAVVDGQQITYTLTDDDGDGTILDPGSVGIPVAAAAAPAPGGGGGGGGSGCALSNSQNPLDLFIFLLPVVWIYGLRSSRRRIN
jgi:hypothetical protein